MDDLIARLESATEGSRELDRAIDLLINPEAEIWSPEWYSGGRDEYLRWPDLPSGAARYRQVIHYTTSIDAARMLVPDGRRWDLVSEPERGAAWVRGQDRFTHASTPALALCIAALRARQGATP